MTWAVFPPNCIFFLRVVVPALAVKIVVKIASFAGNFPLSKVEILVAKSVSTKQNMALIMYDKNFLSLESSELLRLLLISRRNIMELKKLEICIGKRRCI